MKKAKKFLSLLLAMAMVMAMSLTTFAAEKTEVDMSTHSFTAYQIFTASSISDDGVLGNLAWGAGISDAGKTAILEKYEVETVEALAEKLSKMVDNSSEAKEFGQLAYKYVQGNGETVTSGVTTLDKGYYIVVDTTVDAEAYNLSVLRVSDSDTAITIDSKVDVPSVDKEILDTDPTKVNEAAIGEVVKYQITGTMPSNISDYEEYYYWFKDTLSKGLDYNDDAKVYIVNDGTRTEVTKYFYKDSETVNEETVINVAMQDVLGLRLLGYKVDASTTFVVEYSATLNEDAVIAGEGNPNKVDLEYSNNPDKNGDGTPSDNPPGENPKEPTKNYPTGKTPEDKVVTYVTEITITKVDQDGNILTGAEFTLEADSIVKVNVTTKGKFVEAENGEYWLLNDGTYTKDAPQAEVRDDAGDVTVESNEALYASTSIKYAYTEEEVTEFVTADGGKVVKEVGADGTVKFSGITVGDYTLTETKTPEGYNTIKPITFTVEFNNKEFTVKNVSEGAKIDVANNTLSTTIKNQKGSTLPETGGMGTRLFYLIGGLMVLCAGVLLVTKRRMVK